MVERQKPESALKTKPYELVLEKFFFDYITVWFRERIVTVVQYDKARKEIDLLKDMIKTKERRKTEKTDEDLASAKNIRSSQSDGNVPGRCKFRTYESIAEMRNDETQHRQELQSLRQQNENLQQKIYSLKEKISVLQANAHYELTEKDDQIEKLKLQNNDLSKRSSNLAGDKLRHGNPDQANLSDRYKPREVGEMFSEVYDKEWTHAFKNIPKMDEDKKVGILYGIIMNAFSFCKERIEEQDREIKNILIKSNERQQDGRIHKQITEPLGKLRIELVNEMAEDIAQDFESRSLQGLLVMFGLKLDGINAAVRRYALKCAHICWLSLVCIPDVSVSQGEVGAPFDPETYESFSGRLSHFRQPAIAFCVWPVLFQGSNILVKGVAKPMETK